MENLVHLPCHRWHLLPAPVPTDLAATIDRIKRDQSARAKQRPADPLGIPDWTVRVTPPVTSLRPSLPVRPLSTVPEMIRTLSTVPELTPAVNAIHRVRSTLVDSDDRWRQDRQRRHRVQSCRPALRSSSKALPRVATSIDIGASYPNSTTNARSVYQQSGKYIGEHHNRPCWPLRKNTGLSSYDQRKCFIADERGRQIPSFNRFGSLSRATGVK